MAFKNLSGIEIPTKEDIPSYDETPYFDYHHLKAIENVSKHTKKNITRY